MCLLPVKKGYEIFKISLHPSSCPSIINSFVPDPYLITFIVYRIVDGPEIQEVSFFFFQMFILEVCNSVHITVDLSTFFQLKPVVSLLSRND